MGIGEVRIVRPLKYHGKVYCFYKDGKPFSAVIGSANLSVLKLEANNRRQYEICSLTEDLGEAQEIADFIERIKAPACSVNITEAGDMPLIREQNVSLTGIDSVDELPKTDVNIYMVTKEVLAAYGCNSLTFTKTDKTAADEDGNELDVWIVEFISSNDEV